MTVHENQPELPHYEFADRDKPLTTREIKDAERWGTKTKAMILGTVVLGIIAAYGVDVMHGKEALAQTSASVTEDYEATDPQNRDTAIVDLAGLGGLNAANLTEALQPAYAEHADGWAVRYYNEGIDAQDIADKLIEKAKNQGVTKIGLVGHSMGGLVALEVAKRIYESDSSLTVEFI